MTDAAIHVDPGPAPAAPATRLEADRRYRLLEQVGKGSSASVHRALDLELDEVVALKILSPHVAHDARMVERLKREIRIARRLRHPNVAQIYDLEAWDGTLCISMEYLEGKTLETRLKSGPLDWEAAAPVLLAVGRALEAAHDLDIVHRDLKPANVMLDPSGHACVLDFGIAIAPGQRDSGLTHIKGSPVYLAPERWRGIADLPASDVYAFGVLLFETLAGRPPFASSVLRVLFAQHTHASAPDLAARAPDAPRELTALVRRMLDKLPERRPVLRDVMRRLRALAPAPGPVPRARAGTVLVAEDEPLVRRLLAELLRARGVTVLEACDGAQAIALATHERPDLVFLDIDMPGIDGMSALRDLKRRSELAGRPVVMLSGSLDPSHPMLSHRHGAVAFLHKPVNADVLDLVLDRYLR